MKKTTLFLTSVLIFFVYELSGQSNLSDFLIIEKNFPGRTDLEKSVAGRENIYFNNSETNILFQLDSLLSGKQINNLHLYVKADEGLIDFGNLILTSQNADSFISVLGSVKNLIKGRIIVHSNNVFNGANGIVFKTKLEELTGLSFGTR